MAESPLNSEQSTATDGNGPLRTIARRIETLIRVALEGHQKSISAESGVSESTISRWKTGTAGIDLQDVCLVLAALTRHGVVVMEAPSGVVAVPAERIQALTYLAREALS